MIEHFQLFFVLTVVTLNVPFLVAATLRRSLPIRENYVLHSLLLVELACTLLYYFSVIFEKAQVSTVLFYVFALAYFACFAMRGFLFFRYTRYVAGKIIHWQLKLDTVAKVPLYLFLTLICVTPATGALFSYTPEVGYIQGPLYFCIDLFAFTYIALTYAFVWGFRKKINRLTKKAILISNTIIFIGIIAKILLYWDFLISLIMMFAVIVIYLYGSNPYFYTIPDMNVFDKKAYHALALENSPNLGKRDAILMHIDNYRSMRYVYDGDSLNTIKVAIASFVKTCNFKRVYYLDNGVFLIITHGDLNQSDFAMLKGRFEIPWDFAGGCFSISASFVTIPKQRSYIDYSILDKYAEYMFGDLFLNSININTELTKEFAEKTKYDIAVDELTKYAVENDALDVYFQPIIQANSGKVISLEALARLYDEDLGFIPPDYFINTAEKMGLIDELGNQIIRKTCKYVSDNKLDRYGVRLVEINLSPIQCMRKNFANSIEHLCRNFRRNRITLNFEITESRSLNVEKLKYDMNRLIADGYSFSLDDYGTGYSNFINIKTLPFAVIKIDKSLIWNHFEDGGKGTTLPNLVQLLKDMNVEVLAEGVETKEMAEALIDMGFDYLQGFYYAKPMAIDDLLDYLDTYCEYENIFALN